MGLKLVLNTIPVERPAMERLPVGESGNKYPEMVSENAFDWINARHLARNRGLADSWLRAKLP